MMGTEEARAHIAELAELFSHAEPSEPMDERAKVLTVGLAAEVLGALFSIATSLEILASCVAQPHPARPQDAPRFNSGQAF